MDYEGQNEPIMSVGDVVRDARNLIEKNYPMLWIEGEISNFSKPNSGHWYFTLKDKNAQIRCAMFINRNRLVVHQVSDGSQVLVRARLSLYEQRGDFQAIIETIEPAGEGALRAAFDNLKDKLAVEGLFDSSLKRPMPDFPRHLAVISSISGAALHDVLSVIQRRFPALKTTIVPATVQGDTAEASVLEALNRVANMKPLPDVTLITRGGGSLEDLSAFNAESIARSIRSFPVPIVSAIGHETDFTISDFVSDLRAPTPSVAAELVTPNVDEIRRELLSLENKISTKVVNYCSYLTERISELSNRVIHPGTSLNNHTVRLKKLTNRLIQIVDRLENAQNLRLKHVQRILGHSSPAALISTLEEHINRQFEILSGAFTTQLAKRNTAFASVRRTLNNVSPLATVDRGFAIVTKKTDSKDKAQLVRSISTLRKRDPIEVQIADGKIVATIEDLQEI